MKKILLFLSVFVVATAMAQIEVDISPQDLLSGVADARLQELGAQAADEGHPVTVTAPAYWQEMITEQIRAGAGERELQITARETLVESVIVRVGTAGGTSPPRIVQPARQEPTEPSAAPATTPVEPERPQTDTREQRRAAREQLKRDTGEAVSGDGERVVDMPRIQPTAPSVRSQDVMGQPPGAEGDAIEGVDSLDEAVERPGEQDIPPANAEGDAIAGVDSLDEVVEEPAPQVIPPAPETGDAIEGPDSLDELVEEPRRQPVTVAPETGDAIEGVDSLDEVVEVPEKQAIPAAGEGSVEPSDVEARASLEQRLNDGQPITKTLSLGQLRRGDQVFTTGGVAAVVRRTRIGHNVYWLEGELDTGADELRQLRAGKYEVLRRLDVEAPAESEPASEAEQERRAQVDDESHADERSEMEARYNEGRPIESTLSPAGLMTNDMLYVGDDLIVVVRRDKVSLKRFWLVGDLDLDRGELEQVGNRKYRVRRAIR